MNLSPTVSRGNGRAGERRARPREALKGYVVLVFFEQDNWAKVTDINRNGMSFEFDRAPSSHRGVSFTFEVMGCASVSRAGEMFAKSLRAVGDIVWTREFERMAGVQFTDLPKESWGQIREWLSLESPVRRTEFVEAFEEEEEPASAQELFAPLPLESESPVVAGAESPSRTVAEPAAARLETPVVVPESLRDTEPRLAESAFDARMPEEFDAPPEFARSPAPVRHRPEQRMVANPQETRPVFTFFAVCFAAVALAAGVKLVARWTSSAETVEGVPRAVARTQERAGLTSKAFPETDRPFQILVTDLSGKNLLLSFVRGASESATTRVASVSVPFKTAAPVAPAASSQVPGSAAQPASDGALKPDEKLLSGDKFEMVTPKINRTATDDPGANALPVEASIPGDLAAQPDATNLSLLDNHAQPAPPANSPRIGGEVQQARLIKSVSPLYPPLAKSSHVKGDVVVDALIDTVGNVTNVKVVSGPVLLQQAAIQAVRQWKYEPARLDGQAVPMHLSLVVKFRID